MLERMLLCDVTETHKSWKPLLNTIYVLEAPWNVPHNRMRANIACGDFEKKTFSPTANLRTS